MPHPSSAWDFISVSVLVVWVIATAAHSFGIGGWFEPSLGLLAQLLPGWNFFAPTPNIADYFLLYRDYYDTADATPWREVRTLSPGRRRHAWLWNPEKLVSKSLFDIIQALGLESRGASSGSERLLQLSVPYLHLLSYVSSVPRWPAPRATQFMIMQRDSVSQKADVMVVSAMHEISPCECGSPTETLDHVVSD